MQYESPRNVRIQSQTAQRVNSIGKHECSETNEIDCSDSQPSEWCWSVRTRLSFSRDFVTKYDVRPQDAPALIIIYRSSSERNWRRWQLTIAKRNANTKGEKNKWKLQAIACRLPFRFIFIIDCFHHPMKPISVCDTFDVWLRRINALACKDQMCGRCVRPSQITCSGLLWSPHCENVDQSNIDVISIRGVFGGGRRTKVKRYMWNNGRFSAIVGNRQCPRSHFRD